MYRKISATTIKEVSTLVDDGHVWRKYGQKEILNSPHPRFNLFFSFFFSINTLKLWLTPIYNWLIYAGIIIDVLINLIKDVKQLNKCKKFKKIHQGLVSHTKVITHAKFIHQFPKYSLNLQQMRILQCYWVSIPTQIIITNLMFTHFIQLINKNLLKRRSLRIASTLMLTKVNHQAGLVIFNRLMMVRLEQHCHQGCLIIGPTTLLVLLIVVWRWRWCWTLLILRI